MWSGLILFMVENVDLVWWCSATVLSEFMLSPLPGQADLSKNALCASWGVLCTAVK